jgi:hypothetical protein
MRPELVVEPDGLLVDPPDNLYDFFDIGVAGSSIVMPMGPGDFFSELTIAAVGVFTFNFDPHPLLSSFVGLDISGASHTGGSCDNVLHFLLAGGFGKLCSICSKSMVDAVVDAIEGGPVMT